MKRDSKPKKKLSDFRKQSENLNKHTERGMAMLETSMQEVGYAGPMVAAADGEIIDGSARHETAANVFGADAEPIVVESDGKRPIVVVRTDIKDAKSKMAKRLAAYANRTGQVNLEWDLPNLEALLAEDSEAFKGLFGEDELKALLHQVESPQIFPAVGEDIETEHQCPKCGYKWSGGKTVPKSE